MVSRSRCRLPRLSPDAGGDVELPLISDHKLVVAAPADRFEVSQDVIRQGPYPDIELALVPEIDATWVVDRAGIGKPRQIIQNCLLFVGRMSQHPGIDFWRSEEHTSEVQ